MLASCTCPGNGVNTFIAACNITGIMSVDISDDRILFKVNMGKVPDGLPLISKPLNVSK